LSAKGIANQPGSATVAGAERVDVDPELVETGTEVDGDCAVSEGPGPQATTATKRSAGRSLTTRFYTATIRTVPAG
jgi:hypothetical protein